MPRKCRCRDVVFFFSEEKKFKIHEKVVGRVVLKTLSFLRVKSPMYIEVYFLKDNSMCTLNRRFKKIDKKTTILSFRPLIKIPRPEIKCSLNCEAPRANARGTFPYVSSGETISVFRSKATTEKDKEQTPYLGEIYLAPNYIKKKKENIEKLAVHGVVHLLGYTHNRNRDSIRMEALEKRVFTHLKKIGVVS